MNAIPAFASQSTFVPLALEEEDVATYVAMASVLGCTPEECGEGFMMATPLARDAAVLLWRSAVPLLGATEPDARLRMRNTIASLKALLGLDPQLLPHSALAEAGLRYNL